MAQTFNGDVSVLGNILSPNGSSNIAMQYTDSNGAIHSIGKEIGTLKISSGTHIFTNCTGTIHYSGTGAIVLIANSPGLILNGKNETNWQNIYTDGIAEYSLNTTILLQGEGSTPILAAGICGKNDEITLTFGYTVITSDYCFTVTHDTTQSKYYCANVHYANTASSVFNMRNHYLISLYSHEDYALSCEGVLYGVTPDEQPNSEMTVTNIKIRRYLK